MKSYKVNRRTFRLVINTHAYIVLEFPHKKGDDPYIHGVFSDSAKAEAKRIKLITRHNRKGHIAVLKKRILGV